MSTIDESGVSSYDDWDVGATIGTPELGIKDDSTYQNNAEEEDAAFKRADRNDKLDQFNHAQKLRGYQKSFLNKSFWIIIIWLILIHIVLVCVGLGWLKLDTMVITTYLASTTVSVLGIMGIALHWLFPHKTESSSK